MQKRIIFDTSGLNKLADDEDLHLIEAGLKSGFLVGLTMASLEEIAATSRNARRQTLMDLCHQRLLLAGMCLQPFNLIIETLIRVHQRNQTEFDCPLTKPT